MCPLCRTCYFLRLNPNSSCCAKNFTSLPKEKLFDQKEQRGANPHKRYIIYFSSFFTTRSRIVLDKWYWDQIHRIPLWIPTSIQGRFTTSQKKGYNEPVGMSTLSIGRLLPGWLHKLSNQMHVSLMDPNIEQPLPTAHWGGCWQANHPVAIIFPILVWASLIDPF